MVDTAHVKGLGELNKFLTQLPQKMERSIVRGALRAGMKEVYVRAVAKMPKRTGAAALSLHLRSRSRRGVVTARLLAGSGRGDRETANIPVWLEYGTRPHLIKVRESDRPQYVTRQGDVRRMSLSTINRAIRRGALVIAGRFVGPVVHHPGARPRPFMRPALDEGAQAAIRAAAEYIKRRLTRAGLEGAKDVEIEVGTFRSEA